MDVGSEIQPPAAVTLLDSRHAMAKQFIAFFRDVLSEDGFDPNQVRISVAKVVEAINFAARDLMRIESDLEHGASREKFAAYHAFWVARLKPITEVLRLNETGHDEIVDINERMAVLLAVSLVSHGASEPMKDDVTDYSPEGARNVGYQSPPAPLAWRHCKRRCTGQCFDHGAQTFLSYHNFQHFEYLVHSLRHRAVGPYAIVSFLDTLVVASCHDINNVPVIAH